MAGPGRLPPGLELPARCRVVPVHPTLMRVLGDDGRVVASVRLSPVASHRWFLGACAAVALVATVALLALWLAFPAGVPARWAVGFCVLAMLPVFQLVAELMRPVRWLLCTDAGGDEASHVSTLRGSWHPLHWRRELRTASGVPLGNAVWGGGLWRLDDESGQVRLAAADPELRWVRLRRLCGGSTERTRPVVFTDPAGHARAEVQWQDVVIWLELDGASSTERLLVLLAAIAAQQWYFESV